jgi:hypothetical protein
MTNNERIRSWNCHSINLDIRIITAETKDIIALSLALLHQRKVQQTAFLHMRRGGFKVSFFSYVVETTGYG